MAERFHERRIGDCGIWPHCAVKWNVILLSIVDLLQTQEADDKRRRAAIPAIFGQRQPERTVAALRVRNGHRPPP